MFDKKTKIIAGSIVALAVIVVLGIVYAAFTQQLTINGSATGRSSSWKIYFSRLTGPTLNGTAKQITAPEIKSNSTTIGDYSVTVTSPGDYIEYEFDVTNDGDYDATLTGLTINNNNNLTYVGSGDNKTNDENNVKSQIEYTLKYSDGTTVSQNDTLKSKETKTMRLRLTYKTFNDASLLPKADVAISGLGISLTYTQDGNAKVNPNGTTPYVKPYDTYSVGDTFTLGTDSYHVIADSGSNQDYVVALKDTPLKASEITAAGGTVGDTYSDENQTGGMAYHDSSSVYATSAVKSVVDSWAAAKFQNSELKEVNGYSARLITFDEVHSLGYSDTIGCGGACYNVEPSVPNCLYNSNYWYWTMSQYKESSSDIWNMYEDGRLYNASLSGCGMIRPVLEISKDALLIKVN